MISPPSSNPSSPSPRKIKSSNQSSAAEPLNEPKDNENENNSINEQNEDENKEGCLNDVINENNELLTKNEDSQANSMKLSEIDHLTTETDAKERELSEKKSQGKSESNDINNEQLDQQTNEEEEEKDKFQSEASFAHENEPSKDESSRPQSPVPLTAIIDASILLNPNDQKQCEEEENVEEEEISDQKHEHYNDVQYWVNEAMQLQPLTGCNPRIIGKVADGVRKERDNFIELGLYQDSIQANEALSKCLEYKDSVNKKIIQQKKLDELQNRLNDAKDYLKNLRSMVSRLEPNMNSSFEKEMNNLIKRQNHELNRLTVEWESPQKQRMYNRSSANLRSLRTQSILLFNSHRFDEMELASRTADAMEVNESINNQRKLENDFQDALNKMLDKHQSERKQLVIAQKVQKEKYEAAKNHDFLIAQRRIDKLEREIEDSQDPEKVWIHYSRAEARGPPGPRPKAREGRKNCLQAIRTKDFNTLNLPPLVDSPKWKMESPRSPKERQERAKEIAALSRTGGSAALASMMASGRRKSGVRASYSETTYGSPNRKKKS